MMQVYANLQYPTTALGHYWSGAPAQAPEDSVSGRFHRFQRQADQQPSGRGGGPSAAALRLDRCLPRVLFGSASRSVPCTLCMTSLVLAHTVRFRSEWEIDCSDATPQRPGK
eukprot:COSAG02_NODE_276_length_26189_cov_810.678191_5_plen_112_part_00